MDSVYDRISALLRTCEADEPSMPPTILFNEGWMLRLVLDRLASIEFGKEPHPLTVPPECRWYSEALLPSPFLPEYRGDPRSESWTHADGVIGHFEIGGGAKAALSLGKNATHFVVLEAKMFSKLSAGVKNAPYFNQAARNVACIAEVLQRAERKPDEFRALGFYIVAPASQIEQGVFAQQLLKDSLKQTVEKRVSEYSGKRNTWFSDWFLPTHDKIKMGIISWEDLINFLTQQAPDAEGLRTFYDLCVAFNKPREKVEESLPADA
jgi:hypothetical protein